MRCVAFPFCTAALPPARLVAGCETELLLHHLGTCWFPGGPPGERRAPGCKALPSKKNHRLHSSLARSPLLCSLVRSRRAPPRQAQVVSLSPPPTRPRRHALSFRLSLSRALLQGEWLEGARATTQRERESLAPPRLSLPIGSRERAAVSPWQRGGRGSGAALAAAVATTTRRRMMMPEETL